MPRGGGDLYLRGRRSSSVAPVSLPGIKIQYVEKPLYRASNYIFCLGERLQAVKYLEEDRYNAALFIYVFQLIQRPSVFHLNAWWRV